MRGRRPRFGGLAVWQMAATCYIGRGRANAFAPQTFAEAHSMLRPTRKTVAIAGLGAVGVVAGAVAVFGMREAAPPGGAVSGSPAGGTSAPVGTEIKWPYGMDQWGVGRSFVCAAADCGARIEVQIRPKI